MENEKSSQEKQYGLLSTNRTQEKSHNILVVEDDLTAQAMWLSIIGKAAASARITWATSEKEAERLILNYQNAKEPFDLVITDVFLLGPETGFDLWTRCSHLIKGRVIITSGIQYQAFAEYLWTDPCRPMFIKKPLDTVQCIGAVYSMLHSLHPVTDQ